ncbi:AraC family transcriptional regulator [Brucellaceae bacterium VT-16-1752]|nr:AraC family transcriptional regulator [Brucellaceae bacterium VT-16-1752]
MDPIADILETMQMTSVLCVRLDATAPWAFQREVQKSELAHSGRLDGLSDYAHVAMVSRGGCWMKMENEAKPYALTSGDCFLLAPGTSYALGDTPYTMPTNSIDDMMERGRTQSALSIGGGGASTTIICGSFRFKRLATKPLSMFLPRLILTRDDQTRSLTLSSTIQMLSSEMAGQRVGRSVAVTRLVDLLLINMIRAYVETAQGCPEGAWLHAIFDPKIGPALSLIHAHIAKPWTVEALASEAGMSRSAFAARFKELLGQPPLDYVAEWRMQKAAQRLSAGKPISETAKAVGYDSDAAFSKAFKRILGLSPRNYVGAVASERGTGFFAS